MAGIQDFVGMAASQLGLPLGAAQAGAGGMLDLIQKQVGGALFGQVAQAVPGADKIAAPPPTDGAGAPGGGGAGAPPAGGGMFGGFGQAAGGMFGGMAQTAGSMFGGAAGQAASGMGAMSGLMGMLQKAGIGPDKAMGFAGMFVQFLQSKLSPDLMASVMSKVGDLKKLGG